MNFVFVYGSLYDRMGMDLVGWRSDVVRGSPRLRYEEWLRDGLG